MNQKEINHAEWKNPDNWSDSVIGFYFSKKDTRTWVPKKIPWMGWTLNLAHPAGARWMLAIIVGLPVSAALLIAAAIACR